MKSFLFTICICLFGQCHSILWGIAGMDYIDGNGALVIYDMETGKASTITATSREYEVNPNLACYDAVHNLYYNIYKIDDDPVLKLYGYNLSATSVGNATFMVKELTQFAVDCDTEVSPVASGNLCVGDPITGDLYIMGCNANATTTQSLYRATYSDISQSLDMKVIGVYNNMNTNPMNLYSPYARVFDSKRNRMWFTVLRSREGRKSIYSYYYVDAKTGTVIKNNSSEELLWWTADYISDADQIVSVSLNETTASINVLWLDPVSLAINKQYNIPQINGYPICQVEMMSTLDADAGNIWILVVPIIEDLCSNGYLVGIDVKTGHLVNDYPPELCNEGLGAICPESFQWTQ